MALFHSQARCHMIFFTTLLSHSFHIGDQLAQSYVVGIASLGQLSSVLAQHNYDL